MQPVITTSADAGRLILIIGICPLEYSQSQ